MHRSLKNALRRLFVLGICLLVPLVCAVSVAWACTGPGFGVPASSMAVEPGSGVAGTTTTVKGKSFGSGPVEIRWDSTGGPLLASTTGPDFSTSVRVPNAPSGEHKFFAFSRDPDGAPRPGATAAFEVTPGPPAPPSPAEPALAPAWQGPPGSFLPPRDTVGPAIAGAVLTRANGTRTVSRTGAVSLFCGRFTEIGVSGVCGASSVRPLSQARTSARGRPARSVVLRLVARRFRAEPGRPVVLKFVLPKSSMKMLIAAKKVRMRGSVDVRDSSGNFSRASFTLTLKAPTAPSH